LIEAGIPLTSMQTQYSLLDRRSRGGLTVLAMQHGMHLLCYGTLAGGFFSEHWLGQPEPLEGITNRSLVKYKLVIDEFGGWAAFQSLLRLLHDIAQGQESTIGAVAIRAVLDEPAVTSVIVGARSAAHLAATVQALTVTIRADETEAIQALLAAGLGACHDGQPADRLGAPARCTAVAAG
jgi:aryl-alcohol dehydrogenase-like predicted oxidoreductase